MWKEVKYLIFIVVISLFLFFTGKYYFSDENIKKSYRSYNNLEERIKIYSQKLPILENDTKDVIEYAAGIAAFYSKRKNDSLCPVMVTPRKYVRKIKGAPAGAVMVDKEDVILVKPLEV